MYIPQMNEVAQERAVRSFREFVKQAWPVLEPGTDLVWNWHLDAVCDHLDAISKGDMKRLIVNIPPGFAKSLLVSVFWPAFQWLHNPTWRAVLGSYSGDLSNRDSVRCRLVIQSDWYRGLVKHKGDSWSLSGDQNVKSYFKNTASGERLAITVKGKVTGFRGDATIIDDPHLIKTVQKIEELDDVALWYDKVLSTRLNDQQEGVRVLIMQRVHTTDLTGHLLEKYPGQYEHLCLPMEYNPRVTVSTSIFEDPRSVKGELLFEEKYPAKVVEALTDELGPQDYAGQMQQQPVATAGGHFNGACINFWHPPGTNPKPVRMIDSDTDEEVDCFQLVLDIEDEVVDLFSSWDLAFKATTSSDFVAGQVWSRLKGKKAHGVLLDQTHGRFTFSKTQDKIRAQMLKWPKIRAVYVEEAANGAAVLDSMHGEIAGLKAVKPEGGKVSRANAVLPMFEAGQVYFPHPEVFPWVRGLLDELLKFPKARNDDQVDALTQALIKLAKRVTILL